MDLSHPGPDIMIIFTLHSDGVHTFWVYNQCIILCLIIHLIIRCLNGETLCNGIWSLTVFPLVYVLKLYLHSFSFAEIAKNWHTSAQSTTETIEWSEGNNHPLMYYYRTGNIMVAVRPWSVTLALVYRTQGVTCKVAQEPLHRFLYCRSPFFAIAGLPAASSFELFTTRYTCFHSFQPFLQWKDRRTRVTNATKNFRTSLVARYAAPPCVTRYAATYIASTVVWWTWKSSLNYRRRSSGDLTPQCEQIVACSAHVEPMRPARCSAETRLYGQGLGRLGPLRVLPDFHVHDIAITCTCTCM